MRQSRAWLASLTALVVAACGGAGTHGIATATGGNAAPAPTTTVNGDDAFIAYARCMRANGVADFPDPVQLPGHDGLSLVYDGDHDAPAYHSANDACQHLIQSIVDMKTRNARDALTPERLQGLVAYARCMRDQQIPLLDPDPKDGHISFGTVAGIPDTGISRKDPQFAAADAACRSQLPPGVSDDGTGPP
jgi:hypothetical protein